MGRAALIVVPIVLGVYALIDCLTSDRARIRGIGKKWWVALVVLVPLLGPLAWLTAGRPRSRRRPTRRPTGRAPDDDPDFLRTIRTIDEEHEALLRQWERDQRRREGTGPAAPGSPPGSPPVVPPAGPTGSPPTDLSGPAPDGPPGSGREPPSPASGPGHEETTPEASPPDRDDDGTAV